MAQRNVRKFMRHHRSELRFIVGYLDGSAVDEHITAGQGKRVDGLVIHAMKFERIRYSASRELGCHPHSELR